MMHMEYESFFKGKKITVMGLGLLGRGVGDAAFLASLGAELIVTDRKPAAELASSVAELERFPNVSFVLGEHRLEDFRDRDLILKAAGVPLDSPYIAEAEKHGIPVRMSADLFAELSGVPIIGVTGTRGKSTVTHMIHAIMRESGARALLGGNIRGVSTLALLAETTPDAVAVLELDSWQCQGFGAAGLSPSIAVFTTLFPDHANYYKTKPEQYLADKANIFINQKPGDTLVIGAQCEDQVMARYKDRIAGTIVSGSEADLPAGWRLRIPGEHNRYNAALALLAARAAGVPDDMSKKALEAFAGVPGRLEYLGEFGGVAVYNDNNATTPDATIAALRAVGKRDARNVVLIMGGDDKELDMSALLAELPKRCSKIVLFKERGTDRIRDEVFAIGASEGIDVFEENGLAATVARAFVVAAPGETILYSPAFSSFGIHFKNEYDRNDQFVALVKNHYGQSR